jgi:hypothetical protein
VTWGKLLDFFEPHFSYLKISMIIAFLAHSQHSIKVSYFYCLLGGKKAMQKAMQKDHPHWLPLFNTAVSQYSFMTFPESGNLMGTTVFSHQANLCC